MDCLVYDITRYNDDDNDNNGNYVKPYEIIDKTSSSTSLTVKPTNSVVVELSVVQKVVELSE